MMCVNIRCSTEIDATKYPVEDHLFAHLKSCFCILLDWLDIVYGFEKLLLHHDLWVPDFGYCNYCVLSPYLTALSFVGKQLYRRLSTPRSQETFVTFRVMIR